MTTRRLSRGTPVLAATVEQQEAWVKAIDSDLEAVAAIEALTGKAWAAMGFGEKLTAYGQKVTQGEALAGLVAAERVKRDLVSLAAEHRGEVSARDRNALLEQEVAGLRDQVKQLARINSEQSKRIEQLIAAPAMAQSA